ncbi:MAG: hypothetical protein ACE5HB_00365 [Terriglobia bacterium]
MRRIAIYGVVVCLLLLALPAVAQEEEATIYTYVAHFGVARAQWAEYTTFVKTNVQPVLQAMLANGTIVHWGTNSLVVHNQNASTHGIWWAATSIAGIERVREELIKLAGNPATAEATHHDHLLESIIHRGGTADLTSGYLWVSAVKVRPGRGQEWRGVWEKYFKPTYDALVADGTILLYEVSLEYVHTEDPRWRYVWYVAANADAEDKVDAAISKAFRQEAPAIFGALGGVSIRSEHRDFFARVRSYGHK